MFALSRDGHAKLAALDRSQAVIEFEPDGTIVTANDNFLSTLGYSLHEIRGHHHRMFVAPEEQKSPEYQAFWSGLAAGEFKVAEFKRIGKDGREVWIQASYNPMRDRRGRTYRVVKFATDVTAQKLQNADLQGQIAALHKALAVIEFSLDGTIIGANSNFLSVMGYAEDEIRGRHHALFVDPTEARSPDYRTFWEELGRGAFQAGRFRRIAKDGRSVWIQASYNPILDMSGRPSRL